MHRTVKRPPPSNTLLSGATCIFISSWHWQRLSVWPLPTTAPHMSQTVASQALAPIHHFSSQTKQASQLRSNVVPGASRRICVRALQSTSTSAISTRYPCMYLYISSRGDRADPAIARKIRRHPQLTTSTSLSTTWTARIAPKYVKPSDLGLRTMQHSQLQPRLPTTTSTHARHFAPRHLVARLSLSKSKPAASVVCTRNLSSKTSF